jgi:hypothetical protein
MKMSIQLTITRECYILCRLFHCTPEEVLQFYMKQVNIQQLMEDKANDMTLQATAFLAGCAKAGNIYFKRRFVLPGMMRRIYESIELRDKKRKEDGKEK